MNRAGPEMSGPAHFKEGDDPDGMAQCEYWLYSGKFSARSCRRPDRPIDRAGQKSRQIELRRRMRKLSDARLLPQENSRFCE